MSHLLNKYVVVRVCVLSLPLTTNLVLQLKRNAQERSYIMHALIHISIFYNFEICHLINGSSIKSNGWEFIDFAN